MDGYMYACMYLCTYVCMYVCLHTVFMHGPMDACMHVCALHSTSLLVNASDQTLLAWPGRADSESGAQQGGRVALDKSRRPPAFLLAVTSQTPKPLNHE